MSKYNPMYWISRRPPPIETVEGEVRGTGKYVVTDGERILEIYRVQDMAYVLGDRSLRQGHHSSDMLMAYLPRERILMNADLYSPPSETQPAPATPTPGMRTLYENIRNLRLNPERHVPVHGRIGTHEEFVELVTRGSG
jgi:hypothetical protein